MSLNKTLKSLLLIFVSMLLTVTTVFFGASFLRTLYKNHSPWTFWISGVLMFSPIMPVIPAGIFYFSQVILVGLYSTMEKKGYGFWKTSVFSLAGALGFWFSTMQGWLFQKGMTWKEASIEGVQLLFAQMKNLPEAAKNMDPLIIVHQLPGIVVGSFILILGLMIVFEKKSHAIFGYKYEKIASQLKPLEFKMPDFFIWISLVAMLLSSLTQVGTASIVAQNILTVCASAYFFQGLAVIEVLLIYLRASPLLKFFAYFALVGQLLLVLSAVGFIDFWLDFRKRLSTKKKEPRNIF